jgi:hypothetical protein
MVGLLRNWKRVEASVRGLTEVLSVHLPEGTEDDYEDPQGNPVSLPGFAPVTYRMRYRWNKLLLVAESMKVVYLEQ